jgi:HSP20 family protein
MTLVRFNNKPAKSFNNLMDDFFATMPSILSDEPGLKHKQFTPVNIIEKENDYQLELIAPGMNKEDFKINLDNNTLTISAESKDEVLKENEKQIRKEYRYPSFKRSFTIDENIDAENIAAKYINGVLTLNLPKKVEVKTSAKQINIQ